ncbi:hypothetical protein RhiirA1_470039 [Rhizophagus irregularis]|uniref:Uncharacterized protein n=1 Tax=Rhizophagus irregularis TaxID=588596 RepID=A0A2N0R6V2_9GLOM|nr:hypothetical protein RhiirA1_470039 [Rhizophagus irregularis]
MEFGVLNSTIREHFSEVVFCHLVSLQMKREGEIPSAINSFKVFKIITIEERKRKLCRHTSLHFTRKSKDKSSNKDKSKVFNNFQKKNPNFKNKVTGTNRIFLNTRTQNNQEKKKDNSKGTSNQNCKSKDKKDKEKKSPKISKRKLYKKIMELKEMLKKLTNRI